MDEAGLEVHDFKGNGKEKMHGANLNLLGQQGKTKQKQLHFHTSTQQNASAISKIKANSTLRMP